MMSIVFEMRANPALCKSQQGHCPLLGFAIKRLDRNQAS